VLEVKELPELKQREDGHLYDELVPGLIVADPRIQFGSPTIKGTRYPCYAMWLWDYVDKPEKLEEMGFTRQQVIAATAFQAGVDWQKNRKRRKRIKESGIREVWGEFVNCK